MLGKWLLAIFHHVNAFCIHVRNGIYERNRNTSFFFFFPLSKYFGVENRNVFILFISGVLALWLRETENSLFQPISQFVLCKSSPVYVWEKFRIPISNRGPKIQKGYIRRHHCVFPYWKLRERFFCPCLFLCSNDLSRYYLKERHYSRRDRYNQDDT